MRFVFSILFLLLFGCSPICEKKEKSFSDESEIIKEIFSHSYLLKYRLFHHSKMIDKETYLTYTPLPLILYKHTTPPDKSQRTVLEKIIKRKLFTVTKDYKIITDQLFQDIQETISENLEPVEVKIVDKDGFKKYDEEKHIFRFYLSNIGFSEDKKVAVIYVVDLVYPSSGGEKIIFLKKEFESWQIIDFEEIAVF